MEIEARKAEFETFYAENAGRVFRFALRLTGNREEAEDLAAEALAEAYRQWETYRGAASASSWVCGIVLNRRRMQRRVRRVLEKPMYEAAEVASTFKFPNLELANALAKIPAPLRVAFLLVKGEGFSHAEAAKLLRVPVGTVYFWVHVAIRKLRIELGASPRPAMATTIEVTCEHEL